MGFVDGHVIRATARLAEAALDAGGPGEREPLADRHDGGDPRGRPRRRRACPISAGTRATSPASSSGGTGSSTSRRPASSRWSRTSTTRSPRRIPEQGPATIVHGDYRLDNSIVVRDGDVVAVLDWEICTLGDPLADVGLLHVYWTGPADDPSAWAGRRPPQTGSGIATSSGPATPRCPGVTCRSSTSTSRSASGSSRASSRASTPATSAGRSVTRPGRTGPVRAQVDGAIAQAAEHLERTSRDRLPVRDRGPRPPRAGAHRDAVGVDRRQRRGRCRR